MIENREMCWNCWFSLSWPTLRRYSARNLQPKLIWKNPPDSDTITEATLQISSNSNYIYYFISIIENGVEIESKWPGGLQNGDNWTFHRVVDVAVGDVDVATRYWHVTAG